MREKQDTGWTSKKRSDISIAVSPDRMHPECREWGMSDLIKYKPWEYMHMVPSVRSILSHLAPTGPMPEIDEQQWKVEQSDHSEEWQSRLALC